MLKQGFLAITLGLLLWLFLDYQPVDKENTLTVGGPFEFTSQDLAKDGYIYTRMQVAEALVEVQPNGELAPKLATSWDVENEGKIGIFPSEKVSIFMMGSHSHRQRLFTH